MRSPRDMYRAWVISHLDRILLIAPIPRQRLGDALPAWAAGADIVMPQQFLQAGLIADIIEATRPTMSGAVPTCSTTSSPTEPTPTSVVAIRGCGGSAHPRLFEYRDTFGDHHPGLGMTDEPCSPPWPTRPEEPPEDELTSGQTRDRCRCRDPNCDDDGNEMPWDGQSQGEIEVRGLWITGGYYLDPDPEKFHDGRLRTATSHRSSPTASS